MTTSLIRDDIAGLIATRIPGRSLPGDLYASTEAFDLDLDAVFYRSWIFVAVEPDVPEAGDYVTVAVGRHSVIITRDDDEEIRAFHNVCRHRGSRLLDDKCGSTGNIVCPYHQWTYDQQGRLLHAESTPADFDRSLFSLRKVALRNVSGLLFVCLSDDPPEDFDDFAARVAPYLAPHRLRTARIARQVDIVENGNWKLVMENNRECTHCGGHPELLCSLFPVYGYRESDIGPRLRPAWDRYLAAKAAFEEICTRNDLPWKAIEELDTRRTGFRIEREPLDMAGESFTIDGTLASRKLMADFTEPRLGRLSMHLQPNAWFHFLSDHIVTFSVLPLTADSSLLRTTWLVAADAVEGVDYDVDKLTYVWRQTNDQDRAFVARAHAGVGDPAYVPGPYLPPEYQVEAFCNWYVQRVREIL
ncbi:SRPBCC family protein [Nakamurella sp. PAMC28650]|uniref:aromatic ring-hydroxylating oxygenase subunit alpha n=1 Tax=Nakamurella sp. PAMC28650 TaxID=2762325 RepID=UPI00164CEEBC|nr:aromatic ring-hydroxylating dioxygenase subunit alpha [Nakamurella sp. PAMC28650]QNK81824.1 aromatic ring-hydroxylating dioxygenase subunit alpha [Nakamurella sp. PAMC28650]